MIGRRDRAAEFDRLYSEHAERLLGFLVYQTGDRPLAEDILADTFERVLTARSGWRGAASEKTWLYSIALNRLRDLARRRGAEQRAFERVGAAPQRDALEGVEARDELHRALQALSDEERVAVALKYGGDLSLREIAELLEEPETTVEGRVYRGLRRLRETLV
jgi:RNA polymerase sigma-70 factor (ECF subfamily)